MKGGDEMRRWTSEAPASRSILTIARVVVPRTIESSTTTTRLPAMFSRSGLSLRRTPFARSAWVGRDEGATDVAVLHQALAVGDARSEGVPLGGRHPGVGHAHDQVGGNRSLRRQQLAHAASGTVDLVAVEGGVGTGEVHELEDAEAWVESLVREGPLGADLLTVDDDHLARVELPDEGRTDDVECRRLGGQDPALLELVGGVQPSEAEGAEPVGVAHADDAVGVHEDDEKAPSTLGSTAMSARSRSPACSDLGRSGRSGGNAWASSSATRSLSEETMPGSMLACSASASVLVRLPLWARPNPARPTPRNTGWALIQSLEPAVE